MSDKSLSEFYQIKAEGNELFKLHSYSSAISLYSSAICLLTKIGDQHKELSVIYCNRALCQLRLHRYEQCVEDSTSSLKLNPSDIKALYRRAVALQHLSLFNQAIDDVRRILKIEPQNPDALSLGESLNLESTKQFREIGTTHGQMTKVFSVLNDNSAKREDKVNASKNLVILIKEGTGWQQLLSSGKLGDLITLLPSLYESIQKHILHALACLSQQSDAAAYTVIHEIGYSLLGSFLHGQDIELQRASASIIYYSLIQLLSIEEDRVICKEHLQRAEELTKQVMEWISSSKVGSNGREVLLESLLPTVSCSDMQYFLMKNELVKNLLSVSVLSCSSPELWTAKNNGSIVTLLHNFLKSVRGDKHRLKSFKDACFCFVMHRMKEQDPKSCLEGLTVLSNIAQASPELGSEILGNEKILSVALLSSKSADETVQMIVAENIALAASDKDRYHPLIDSMSALKSLYMCKNPEIRVRAMVAICKLSALNKNESEPDSSLDTYVQDCREFLIGQNTGGIKRWAVEGLAFLSISAPVKEFICKDEKLLHSVFDLMAKSADTAVHYGAATLLVNLTNSYEQPERQPELEQLARFSGENVPTPHEFDGSDYLIARISLLLKLNIVPVLNLLSCSHSLATSEQTSRIFLALVESESNRGCIVQQGGGKSLISLAKSNSDIGRHKAAQAIAKISITTNPQLAFPGERVLETISPLVMLLKSDRQLQQFEALMALTNISSLGQKFCKKIVLEKGVHWIESLQFEEHEMLRRAATECMCNLVVCDEVKELYKQDGNDRIKLLTLFSGEEDRHLRIAASGALCILSEDEKICKRILDVKQYFEITEELLGSGDDELQFRAVYILTNIVLCGSSSAEVVLGYARGLELFELCTTENFSERVRGIAKAGIEQLISYGLVKGNITIPD
ncbi:Protein unc-45-like protein B [Oopsacas minuta]|uniref:Protein unc-45-like protein B n=1 Tax=Oopsacas minuta TaxID=111878 RepID=A0AAV7KE28_9METZ|nr:Protein unc-45-like protein B [Oopsacas minuta]